MPGDCLYAHVEKHANRGSILDLGCGPGTTGTELAADSYACYTGVDISGVAVEKATQRAARHGRAGTNRYVQADIFSYQPNQQHDVILFGDSLYYVPWRSILSMLNRYSAHLNADGVFIARIYGRRFQSIMDLIESHFQIVEKAVYADEVLVMTFRPSASHAAADRQDR